MRPETPTRHLSGGTQDPAAQVSLQFEEGAALELGLRASGTEMTLKSGRGDTPLPPAQRETRMESGAKRTRVRCRGPARRGGRGGT